MYILVKKKSIEQKGRKKEMALIAILKFIVILYWWQNHNKTFYQHSHKFTISINMFLGHISNMGWSFLENLKSHVNWSKKKICTIKLQIKTKFYSNF
jgi:hypothetical protein